MKVTKKTIPLFVGDPPLPDKKLLQTKLLLRPDEVADILRISRRKVYAMIELGELEGVKLRKAVRVKTSSVLDILKE